MKRIFALLMTLAMLTSGCSLLEQKESTTKKGEETTASTTAAQTTTAKKDTAPEETAPVDISGWSKKTIERMGISVLLPTIPIVETETVDLNDGSVYEYYTADSVDSTSEAFSKVYIEYYPDYYVGYSDEEIKQDLVADIENAADSSMTEIDREIKDNYAEITMQDEDGDYWRYRSTYYDDGTSICICVIFGGELDELQDDFDTVINSLEK